MKRIYLFTSLLIYLNTFSINQEIFDNSLLVNKIKSVTINMGLQFQKAEFKVKNPSKEYVNFVTKNDFIKVFNLNDPYQGIFIPASFKDLNLLFSITPNIIKDFKYTENTDSPYSWKEEPASLTLLPKFSTYFNIDNYYFEFSLILKYQPYLETNTLLSSNNSIYEKTKHFEKKPYIRVSILRDFKTFKTGLVVSNFIKIDKDPEGLNSKDMNEVTPYLIARSFTFPFYKFNEVYEPSYFYDLKTTSPSTYKKTYGYKTSIYRINPKILFNIKKITFKGNGVIDVINYHFSIFDSYNTQEFKIKGDFINAILNISLNTFIGEFTSVNLKIEKNIISKLNEKDNKGNTTKLEYNYESIGIHVNQETDLGYEVGLRFLKLTSSIKCSFPSLTFISPQLTFLDMATSFHMKLFRNMKIKIGAGAELFENEASFESHSVKGKLGTELKVGNFLIKFNYNLNFYFDIKNTLNITNDDYIVNFKNKGPVHNVLFNVEYRL